MFWWSINERKRARNPVAEQVVSTCFNIYFNVLEKPVNLNPNTMLTGIPSLYSKDLRNLRFSYFEHFSSMTLMPLWKRKAILMQHVEQKIRLHYKFCSRYHDVYMYFWLNVISRSINNSKLETAHRSVY
jgi:hypothetical protein